MTDQEREEMISAAIDGERVDVEALRAALTDTDGRAALAAFVLLRAAMAADDAEPRRKLLMEASRMEASREVTPETAALHLHAAGAARTGRSRRVVALPAGLAAAAVVFIAAGAFWLGSYSQAPFRRPAPSPSAAQTSAPPPSGRSLPGGAREGVPPTPVRVLHYTPGVDWHPGS